MHLHFSFLHLMEVAMYLAIIRYIAYGVSSWLGADSTLGQAVGLLFA